MSMQTVNPATGRLVREWPETSADALRAILERAAAAQRAWAAGSFAQRATVLHAAAKLLRERAPEYARLMAEEMGKPLAQGRGEVEKCALVCEYYARQGEAFLAPQPIATEARSSYVAFNPLGVVLAVMPWNFPMWQVYRFAAPALMAGNGGLLKHAANVQGSAVAMEQLWRDAGLPEGLFANIAVGSARVAEIIRAPQVAAVTLTGSTPAGKAVAGVAASVLKPSVLELGGSDPYLVLADADLELAAKACVASRLINTGQSCIAAKRFIVVRDALPRFTELVVEAMRGKTFGDPLQDEGVDLGPMARVDLRDELHDQVQRSVKAGAKLLLGGVVPPGPGAFYPPTVLGGVTRAHAVYAEETFGPVASILPARDEADAVAIANDSCFGLGAAVFTRDVARGERLAARELNAGAVFVNDFVRSDPRLPFGGIKESGWGRELSAFGIREFVNIKTVYVAQTS